MVFPFYIYTHNISFIELEKRRRKKYGEQDNFEWFCGFGVCWMAFHMGNVTYTYLQKFMDSTSTNQTQLYIFQGTR